MNKLSFFWVGCILSMLLVGCSSMAGLVPSTPTISPTPTETLAKVNSQIGITTLAQGDPALPYQSMWTFCDYIPDGGVPAMISETCSLPSMTGVTVTFGWIAKETIFESNWEQMSWTFELDGVKVDLNDFKYTENKYIQHGDDNISRVWNIDLLGLAAGEHTMRVNWRSDSAVEDGTLVYQPGAYDHLFNFTVLEPETYPNSAAPSKPGFQKLHSKSSGLNFVMYDPRGPESIQGEKMPLLVYLHGSSYRGVPLALLQESVFASQVAGIAEFPFVTIAPVGDGGFEFWTKEPLKTSLLTLITETVETYALDPTRVVLIGDGMGANGVWVVGLETPKTFSALVPVGGYASYPFTVPANICDLKEIPVWAFHGGMDVFVPAEVEQQLVDALSACGGKAQMTMHEDMTINILHIVYRDKELYDWLALQSK